MIANFLDAVADAAHEAGASVRIVQLAGEPEDASPHEAVERVSSNDKVAAGLAGGEFQVVGGTSWLWARDDMAEAVDVLFVDEAGQLSLADVCAVAGSATLAGAARRPQPAAAGLAGHPP